MNGFTKERQKLIEVINTLPDEALMELASFIDYLYYKSTQRIEPQNHNSNFLLSIAGLGNSNQNNISERDEEILKKEVDPIHGWNLKADDPA
jgi:hypothetical protein